MNSKNIGHSKYRNTGVLFELLVRRMAADAMENKMPSPATKIMKEFFSPSTALGKEMVLYRAFFETGQLSENKALKFIDIVSEQRKKLSEQELSLNKYKLIKEIQKHYDIKEFLSCKIPNYKIHAAIYKTFNSENVSLTESILNIHEIAKSRFTLVEHLITPKKVVTSTMSESIKELLNKEPVMQNIVYKNMVRSFNEKYQGFTDPQKNLLREYINSIADTSKFFEYARSDAKTLAESLRLASSKSSNKIISIKLNEVANQIAKIAVKKVIKENDVSALMLAHEIKKETLGE